jgi:hypothetical protein
MTAAGLRNSTAGAARRSRWSAADGALTKPAVEVAVSGVATVGTGFELARLEVATLGVRVATAVPAGPAVVVPVGPAVVVAVVVTAAPVPGSVVIDTVISAPVVSPPVMRTVVGVGTVVGVAVEAVIAVPTVVLVAGSVFVPAAFETAGITPGLRLPGSGPTRRRPVPRLRLIQRAISRPKLGGRVTVSTRTASLIFTVDPRIDPATPWIVLVPLLGWSAGSVAGQSICSAGRPLRRRPASRLPVLLTSGAIAG